MLATKFGGNFIINLLGVWAVSNTAVSSEVSKLNGVLHNLKIVLVVSSMLQIMLKICKRYILLFVT